MRVDEVRLHVFALWVYVDGPCWSSMTAPAARRRSCFEFAVGGLSIHMTLAPLRVDICFIYMYALASVSRSTGYLCVHCSSSLITCALAPPRGPLVTRNVGIPVSLA